MAGISVPLIGINAERNVWFSVWRVPIRVTRFSTHVEWNHWFSRIISKFADKQLGRAHLFLSVHWPEVQNTRRYQIRIWNVIFIFQLSHVWFCVAPWTIAHQAPLSTGILQARILEWAAMPFPTQGLNPGLLHHRWILYQLSYQGSPYAKLKYVNFDIRTQNAERVKI